MITQFHNARTRFVLANSILLLCGISYSCFAEGVVPAGTGVNGVNRRVKTNGEGYGEVSGTFTEPDFHVPGAYSGDSYIFDTNEHHSKPSFYFGSSSASSQIEVDAGFQWEFDTRYGLKPGWVAFVASNSSFTNYSTDLFNVWRTPKGSLGSAKMTYRVNNNGRVVLYVGGLSSAEPTNFNMGWNGNAKPAFDDGTAGQKVFPTDANNVITSTAISDMAVKRVVAMTQSSGVYKDGSYMRNTTFSGGQILKVKTDAKGNVVFPISYLVPTGGWPLSAVDQSQTGYDTPGSAYDYSLSSDDKRRWIVDFDFDGMAAPPQRPLTLRGPGDPSYPTGLYRDVEVPARYPNETVHITLQDVSPVAKGEPLRRGYVKPR